MWTERATTARARWRSALAAAGVIALSAVLSGSAVEERPQRSIVIRGHALKLHLYGPDGGDPIVVSSGDGGWVHLAPHVAEVLAAQGYFVVGLDAKAYLATFTTGRTTVRPQDEPGDYRVVADFAAASTGKKPILIGVSEGAGLSLLAATDPQTKAAIAGVIGLGLPELTELGWRWRDALIYITKRTPNEPTVSASAVVGQVAPVPLALIHSTHDEFVPLAQIQHIFQHARDPKQLRIVDAADHGFSNNLAEFDRQLLETIAWVQAQPPR